MAKVDKAQDIANVGQQVSANVNVDVKDDAGTTSTESTVTVLSAETSTPVPTSVENLDCTEEVSKMSNIVERLGEKVASHPVGQTLFRQGDHMLWILEECLLWGVHPSDDVDQTAERPLPWIAFLPLMGTLRLTEIGARRLANLLGREPVPVNDVVTFIRRQRRQIHAIKSRGTSKLRSWDNDSQDQPQKRTSLVEELLFWWPLTVVTKMVGLLGLGSQSPRLARSAPVKHQQIQSLVVLDIPTPEYSSENEQVVVLPAEEIVKMIHNDSFGESNDADSDYEPREIDSDTDGVPSLEDVTSEEENTNSNKKPEGSGTKDLSTAPFILQEQLQEMKNSDCPKIMESIEEEHDQPGKQQFYSPSSTVYLSPAQLSTKTSSNPDLAQEAAGGREESSEGRRSKFSSLFRRKKSSF